MRIYMDTIRVVELMWFNIHKFSVRDNACVFLPESWIPWTLLAADDNFCSYVSL